MPYARIALELKFKDSSPTSHSTTIERGSGSRNCVFPPTRARNDITGGKKLKWNYSIQCYPFRRSFGITLETVTRERGKVIENFPHLHRTPLCPPRRTFSTPCGLSRESPQSTKEGTIIIIIIIMQEGRSISHKVPPPTAYVPTAVCVPTSWSSRVLRDMRNKANFSISMAATHGSSLPICAICVVLLFQPTGVPFPL